MLILFVFLGLWQIERAKEKELITLQYMKKIQQPAVSINLNNKSLENYYFLPTKITGQWLAKKTYLHDNVTKDGVLGVEVLSILSYNKLAIIINRGWLEKTKIKTTNFDSKIGNVVLQGIWTQPLKRFILKETPLPKQFPKLIQILNVKQITNDLNLSVFPLQLRLTTNENNLFDTHWEPVFGDPNKHYGYAMQWFSFSFILMFLIYRLNLTKTRQNHFKLSN